MDWENERYVRFYTRRTADDLALCWQARAIWPHLLAISDLAGFIHIKQGERRLKLLAGLLLMPLEFVVLGMPDLLEDGRIREIVAGYFIPNYIAANESKASDVERKRKSRERRRDQALAELADGVTKRDELSRNVTDRAESTTDGDVTKRDRMSQNVTEPVTRSRNVTFGHKNGKKVTPTLPTLPSLSTPPSLLPPSAPVLRVVSDLPPEQREGGEEEFLEPEEADATGAQALEAWSRVREARELGPDPRLPEAKRKLKHLAGCTVGMCEELFFAYTDPKRAMGLQAAGEGYPLVLLLGTEVQRRRMPQRPARGLLCAKCREPSEGIRDGEGRPTCYRCHGARMRELEAAGAR